MATSKFDPSQYLSKVSGQDYLEVKWRLVWLRSEHPDAALTTNMEFNDGDRAIFSARVEIPGGGVATGWGSELANAFGNFIEKAETKAIGRALAAIGYGTQFCGDFEEGPDVSNLSDSPVQLRRAGSVNANGNRGNFATVSPAGASQPVSERQMSLIQALRKDLRIDVTQLDELCVEIAGQPLAGINRGQASQVIDRMKERLSTVPGKKAS
jgi:hypothetical protein